MRPKPSPRPRRRVPAALATGLRATFALALVTILAVRAPGTARAAAVAVGTNGVSMTSSTVGLTWNAPVIIDGGVSFAGVWFSTPTNGIAVGNGNSIFRSVNGGGSWSPISSPVTTTYNDVMFPTEAIGYIAATSGQVLKSTNSGASWTAQSTGSPGGLLGIHFVSATQGCAVGVGGAIVRTTNGGTNWTNESTGSTDLTDVFFFDASNGWAVGNGGTILRSTNGGDTWNPVTSGTTANLTGVWFTSATLGFVCGGDRVLRRTTNGGTSWSDVTLPTTNQITGLFDVMFADPDTGIVVGSGHNALRTLNGGTTWELANPDPTGETLQAVHLSRPPGPPPQITVTVNALPAGRTFSVDGVPFTTPQEFTWDAGSSHQLQVTSPQAISAGERYSFTAWSGGSTSTQTSINVSPTTNTSFTANFQRQFLLTMTNVTGGTVSPSGATWRNAGSTVPISANDGTGYDFVSWAGSGAGSYTGTNNPASVTMNGAITETADFDPVPITLTFQTSPAGKSVIVDGTTRVTPYVLATTAAVQHSLDVPSPQGESGGTRFVFGSWSDGGARQHTIEPLTSQTLTATLDTQHFLDMSVSPAGSGTATPGDGWHDAGDRVGLSATPSIGYFVYFHQGGGTGSYDGFPGAAAQATMDGPVTQTVLLSNAAARNVTVAASPPGPNLTAAGVDIGSSKTFSWPNGVAFPIGAPSTQDAIANVKRWQWTSWSDGGARTHTVTPTTSAPRYTANFDVQFELTMSAESGGTTTPPPGDSWVDSNTVVPITALPDANHEFQGWSGTGSSAYSGSNNPASFTIRGKVAELARFDLLPRLTLPDLTAEQRRFVAGEPETIRFVANYASTTAIRIEYKHVIQSTWLLAGTALPQSQLLVWTPPDDPQSNLQMRILSPSPNVIADTLSGTFQICDPYFNAGPAISALAASTDPQDVVSFDANNDGVLDVAIATAQGFVTRLGLASPPGTGTGGFAAPVAVAVTNGTKRLVPVDFDADGDSDLIGVPRSGTSPTFVYSRNGTAGAAGAFQAPGALLAVYGRFEDVAVGDVDEDGIQDVVGLSGATSKVAVYRGAGTNGNANGSWGFLGEVATLSNPVQLRLADLNRDGRLDVVLLTGAPGRLVVHFGSQAPPGSGPPFGPAQSLSLGFSPSDFTLADFDEDGLLDVAWTDAANDRLLLVPRVGAAGPAGPVFGTMDTVVVTTGFHTRLEVADFDRDAHADLVGVDVLTDSVTIWRGHGDGTFSLLTARATPGEAQNATVQDFLEDGRSDLLLTGSDGTTALLTGDFASCQSFGGSLVFLDEPNAAGLAFAVGQEMTILWRPFGGGVILADLDVSRDDGATWRPIARGLVQRTFSWTVTPPATTKGLIRVRSSTGHIGADQSTNLFAIVDATVDVPPPPALPTVPAFAAPVPNPVRGTARFALDLPAAARVSVALYDVAGRRVRTLLAGDLPAGSHALAWDGTDDAGRRVAAGVYLARARWAGFAQERRLVRLGE